MRRDQLLNMCRFALRLCVGFFTLTILIRSYEAETSGVFLLVWSLASYLAMADLGCGFELQTAIASKDKLRAKHALSLCNRVLFRAAVIAGLLLALVSLFFLIQGNRIALASSLLGAAALVCFRHGYLEEILHAELRFDKLLFAEAAQSIGILGACVAGAYWESYWILFAGAGLASLLALALRLRFTRDMREELQGGSHALANTALAKDTWLTSLSNLVLTRTDAITLSVLGFLPLVALYSGAAKAGDVAHRAGNMLLASISPQAARADSPFVELRRDWSIVSWLAGTGLMIVWFFHEWLLTLWIGTCTPQMSIICVVLTMSAAVHLCVKSVPHRIWVVKHKSNRVLRITLIEAFANVSLSVALGLALGWVGIALGTTLASFISVGITFFYLYRDGMSARALNSVLVFTAGALSASALWLVTAQIPDLSIAIQLGALIALALAVFPLLSQGVTNAIIGRLRPLSAGS